MTALTKHLYSSYFKYKGINEKKLNIKYITIEEFMNTKKTFDRILGNPPYNDAMGSGNLESGNTNNSNLYNDFILKSITLAKHISLIVPSNWMYNDKIRNEVIDAGLKKVVQVDPANFPGVTIRSGVSELIVESGYRGKIEIKSLTASFKIDRDSVLSFDDPKKFIMIEKLKSTKMFNSLLSTGPYKVPRGTKGSIERLVNLDSNFSELKTKKHTTPVIVYAGGSSNDERYVYHTDNNTSKKWGVTVPTVSEKYIIGAVRLIKPNTGVSDRLRVAYFDTKQEAENVKQYLESKLISFVVRTTKHNDTVNTNKNSFGNIPVVDFTKQYTDSKLLKLFNITKEELDAIK